jgi:hypothetical protein
MKNLLPSLCLLLLVASAGAGEPPGHPHGTEATVDVNVPRASGPDGRTVAEIITTRAELKDKAVTVRARVVKFNPAIMGKNWLHVRDGSGSAAANTNDLLVTSSEPAQVGDILTMRGTVRTDKDFGYGYFYGVLVEDANLQK